MYVPQTTLKLLASAAGYIINTFTNKNQGQTTYFAKEIDVLKTYTSVILFMFLFTEPNL